MTFDEALDAMERHIDPGEAIAIFQELKGTYAPTIYMSKQQYTTFKNWRFHTAGWHLSNCLEWARDENIAATDAMQIWLHPECIIVVE